MKLGSYLSGAWVQGRGRPAVLVNPSTEEPLAEASTEGLDLAGALQFARSRGGPALRAASFAQRGEMLARLSTLIRSARDALVEIAVENGGNTRADAKLDIDGASGTLAYYASIGRALGDRRILADGEPTAIGRSESLAGGHILVPREGVAVHVNAFNFPAWGFAEKAAVALLAGVPVVTKPATSTALVAHRIVSLCVEAGFLPDGTLSLLTGGAGDLLDHLTGQDVLAFTGSRDTAALLRTHPNLARASVRINVEADSLNAAILGPDASRGSVTWTMFVSAVLRDMTEKAGQKCTAIRRVLVPRHLQSALEEDLASALARVRVGNPVAPGVAMGPLATASQLRDVRAGIERLCAATRTVWTSVQPPLGAPPGRGFFQSPLLLAADRPSDATVVHEHEVFGPVATVLPYDAEAEAAEIVRRAHGCLVSSLFSDDRGFALRMVQVLAAWNGRLHVAGEDAAEGAPPPGTVFPQLVHGGPGRAGGGEELGAERGLHFYSQRTALQCTRDLLESLAVR